MNRDIFSNNDVRVALYPTSALDATTNGEDIDCQGYESLMFNVTVGRLSLISTASNWQLRVQHTDASALGLGPSTYADAASIDMIREASGAVTSGVWQALNLSTLGSAIYKVGYRGTKRYVRVVVEKVLTPSYAEIAATAVLGRPANWAVTTPN